MKRLILFDMDGVLFDTMKTHASTWQETAIHFGLKVKEEEFYMYEGQKGHDTITQIYERTYRKSPPIELVNEIYEYKTKLFSNRIQIRIIPGVLQLMDFFKRHGFYMGVVTGSSQQNTVGRINKYFSEYIAPEHIITANDVKRGKPAPDPYLAGMKTFEMPPNATYVIENAPLGVRSAHASGAYVLAVTTGPIPSDLLKSEGANEVFSDMSALLEWWKDKI